MCLIPTIGKQFKEGWKGGGWVGWGWVGGRLKGEWRCLGLLKVVKINGITFIHIKCTYQQKEEAVYLTSKIIFTVYSNGDGLILKF